MQEMEARASLYEVKERFSFRHLLASLPVPNDKEEVASLCILQEEVDVLGIFAGRV